VPVIHPDAYTFAIGRASMLREGSDLTLIANGIMSCRALEAAALLDAEGVSATVLNMATVKPLDRDAIVRAAAQGPILTIEEHTIYGGLGSAVAEAVVTSQPTRMRMLGVPGVFAPTGSASFLLEHFQLTPQHIRDAARVLVHESRAN
jgi:transketolase